MDLRLLVSDESWLFTAVSDPIVFGSARGGDAPVIGGSVSTGSIFGAGFLFGGSAPKASIGETNVSKRFFRGGMAGAGSVSCIP